MRVSLRTTTVPTLRWAGLLVCGLAVFALAAACSGDTSLEDLGSDVQSTRVAQATIDFENATPEPTPTPEPAVNAELRALNLHADKINNFLSFMQLRLAMSPTIAIGGIGDNEGNLNEGWLDVCCGNQASAVLTAHDDANEALGFIRALYEEDDAVEHLALVPGIQALLDEAQAALDALATAPNLDGATSLVVSAQDVIGQLDAAIDGLVACCGPEPTPTPSPTPTPEEPPR